jgi:branched-chain amino acid transport system substrate-binding protein
MPQTLERHFSFQGVVVQGRADGRRGVLRATGAAAIGMCWPGWGVAQTGSGSNKASPIPIAMIEGLSGSFANAGEAVWRNLLMAVERVNARGGVRLSGGARPLALLRYDSKGTAEESLSALRSAIDAGAGVVMQGNSSAAAAALVDALNKHNLREPARQALFLNYSAVDPALTQEKCSFWHFRFDAHADMRLDALTEVLRGDASVDKLYLLGQDYSFGQHVLARGREVLRAKRPDIAVVGEELHPLGRVKDFAPYAAKIKASGAQAVLTGNWGNDLTLLVKAAREAGVEARFYTFYGNGLGAPAAIGDAGVGRVLAVAEWHPNLGTPASDAFYLDFRRRFPRPQDDYVHLRMHAMVELLATAMERADATEALPVARALENLSLSGTALQAVHQGHVRASDHQFVQPLVVSEMQRIGTPGVRFDNEGSGYGFRTVLRLEPSRTEPPNRCRMERPT